MANHEILQNFNKVSFAEKEKVFDDKTRESYFRMLDEALKNLNYFSIRQTE
ncbi:MAG: hypothetical protein JJU28_02610 [Cyclobacteriaceae bacterium]|nr:hypothetical protein [Cyclobacteriaceae bacterium]